MQIKFRNKLREVSESKPWGLVKQNEHTRH
jgi:hypothetical protein